MVHKNFLQNTQKAQAQKVINYTLSKLKTFALQETLKENKKTSHGLGKNTSKHVPHIILHTKYIKNTFKSRIKIQKIQFLKMGKRFLETSPKIYE